jgi:hypothetical protein
MGIPKKTFLAQTAEPFLTTQLRPQSSSKERRNIILERSRMGLNLYADDGCIRRGQGLLDNATSNAPLSYSFSFYFE